MKRQTGTDPNQEELAVEGGGSSGGTVDQGNAGVDPWLVEIDPTQLPLPVSATIDTTGLATEAKQDVGNASLASIDGKLTSPLTVTGPLTDTQLRATPVPVSGTITANAGTNLNTSLLALESGGNLAAIAASASVLDDWDESDRAKVNLIPGQAGITAGAGNSATNTPRVTIATDDVNLAAINAVLGTTSGAKVITDVAGTVQQYLRGLVYLLITPLAAFVTVARQFVYGGVQTLTTTNWLSLTTGSGWQSEIITTGGASEIQFNLTTLGAAGSTLLADFYLAEAFTSGNFTDGVSGGEATFTAANRKNSRYIGSLQLNTTNSVTGMLKYTDVSGSLPERVKLIGINNSGGTISSTAGNTVFTYELIR